MRIRFDQERYRVRESDGSVLVCIEVLGAMFQIETLLNVFTVDETNPFSGAYVHVAD